MGRSHAASAAAVWLTGCAAPTVLDLAVQLNPALAGPVGAWVAEYTSPQTPTVITVGVALGVYGAILVDIDHISSTAAHSLGPFTGLVARAVARFSAWVHAATRTKVDRRDLDGHRTLTHTILFAVLVGAGVAALCAWGGVWASLAVIFVAAETAFEILLPKRRKHRRRAPLYALALTAVLFLTAAPSGAWLGLALAVGCITHCLGDACTNSGCPMLWPIRIRGKRWYPVGLPLRWRFSTRAWRVPKAWWWPPAWSAPESRVWLACWVVVVAATGVLFWPWVASVAAQIATVL